MPLPATSQDPRAAPDSCPSALPRVSAADGQGGLSPPATARVVRVPRSMVCVLPDRSQSAPAGAGAE